MDLLRTKQCEKCPWKVDTDPYDIPNGYCEHKHADLERTIAKGLNIGQSINAMACHESEVGKDTPCIGWLMNQLGPGNNIALRMAMIGNKRAGQLETVGEQHDRFEDTLPA